MQNSFIITIPSSEYLTFNFILTNQYLMTAGLGI